MMAEIQRRIRFNTISMSVLMITIAVGVLTAMWMYADALVWLLFYDQIFVCFRKLVILFVCILANLFFANESWNK